ncbi:extracellular solute-binding protein [Sinorhizobium meliloti]|uniref:extracellular solute-binding protein n=1 Tax=Rhizobium meliloti TaxID=382 RepID=UPI00042A3A2D|nr:extracellular solute-binding protein [Sinorhizobium meliloti]MDE4615944.1 extracellular solute-binding protein [Sinorhizobium meliloti]
MFGKRKHIIAIGLSACIGLASYSPSGAEPGTVIRVVQQGSAERHSLIAQGFMARNPHIRVELQTFPGYEEIAQLVRRESLIGDAPDVVAIGYDLVRYFSENALATPLEQLSGDRAALVRAGYPEASLGLCSHAGNVIGLPYSTSAPVLFINSDLVRSTGHDPEQLPTTWDAIIELAREIRAQNPATTGLHFRYDHSGNWSFQALIFSQGGAMMDARETSVAFGDATGLSALNVLASARDTGMVDQSSGQARQAFAAGLIGIMADSSAAYASLLRSAEGAFALNIAPYPFSADGKLPAGGACNAVTSQDEAKVDAAWEFVKFATGPDGQDIQAGIPGYIRTNTRPTATNETNSADQRSANEEVLASLLPRLTAWYGFPGDNATRIPGTIKSYLQSVVAGNLAPDEALKAMVAEVSQLLNQQ